jgi:hypothetical protein
MVLRDFVIARRPCPTLGGNYFKNSYNSSFAGSGLHQNNYYSILNWFNMMVDKLYDFAKKSNVAFKQSLKLY